MVCGCGIDYVKFSHPVPRVREQLPKDCLLSFRLVIGWMISGTLCTLIVTISHKNFGSKMRRTVWIFGMSRLMKKTNLRLKMTLIVGDSLT
jgi:hypothetical protein